MPPPFIAEIVAAAAGGVPREMMLSPDVADECGKFVCLVAPARTGFYYPAFIFGAAMRPEFSFATLAQSSINAAVTSLITLRISS